jgi:hypothetical protein
MADGHMVKPRQTHWRPLIIAAALAVGGALAIGPVVVAADKKKSSNSNSALSSGSKSSSSSSSSKRGRGNSSGNNSIHTQELAGDALAEKLGTSKPTSRPSESADDVRSRLSDVQDDINAEDERHAAALASIQKSGGGSRARKAVDKENATHEQRRAALDEQRRSLIVRLNDGKGSDETSEPAAPAPTAKKLPLKAANTRKR